MELLLLSAAVAIVVVAFSVAEYIDAKANALRPKLPDKQSED